jgi:hypothetical protein
VARADWHAWQLLVACLPGAGESAAGCVVRSLLAGVLTQRAALHCCTAVFALIKWAERDRGRREQVTAAASATSFAVCLVVRCVAF